MDRNSSPADVSQGNKQIEPPHPGNEVAATAGTSLEHPQTVEEALRLIDDLKFFLATAPANWQDNQIIRRYYLNHDEGFVSCIFWNNLYFVTGTDIVKCLIYRIELFGRAISDRKKFEEGIFSDLRNLKCGADAILEPPKSKFLEFLYKNSCLRTQKKQKVFFWFSVQHDKMFADALERDLKRENAGQKTTTKAEREPALLFKYDESKSLIEQLTAHLDKKKESIRGAGASKLSNTEATNGTYNNDLNNNSNAYDFASHSQAGQPPGSQEEDIDGYQEPGFPLDFLPPNEYISETVDPYNTGGHNNVPMFDPSMFIHPQAGPTNFDDFLIDQALPYSPVNQIELKQESEDGEIDSHQQIAGHNVVYPGAPLGLLPGQLNPAMLGMGGELALPAASYGYVDPSAYYDHVSNLQAQQHVVGLLNPSFAGYPMAVPSTLNHLQQQQLQAQNSSAARAHANKLKNLGAYNGRVSKPDGKSKDEKY